MEQGTRIDRAILNPIRRLQQGNGDEEVEEVQQERQQQHRLVIDNAYNVNRQSVQYLVDFLSGDTHRVTELWLCIFYLSHISDGGLDVLIDFFAKQTTLTKVTLDGCNFGSVEDPSQLLAALTSNGLVTDLTIYGIGNLRGAALGNCISGVLQNNPRLERLELGAKLDAETVRALQPGLRSNRHLKILDLSYCWMKDEGLHLIVDALVGNTTIEVLDIRGNRITRDGLDDITRLVKFTQLKKIRAGDMDHLFADDMDAVRDFISVLRGKNTSLEEFESVIDLTRFRGHWRLRPRINNILTRNVNIRHAKELLALQPRTELPIGSKSGIWYMAMAKMAEQGFDEPQIQSDDEQSVDDADESMDDSDTNTSLGEVHNWDENGVVEENHDDNLNGPDATATPVGEGEPSQEGERKSDSDDDADDDSDNGPDAIPPSYPGASAIFKIFQARPAIIEKQLRRPAATAAHEEPQDSATTKQHDERDPTAGKNGGDGSSSGANDESNSSSQTHGRKRQRTL